VDLASSDSPRSENFVLKAGGQIRVRVIDPVGRLADARLAVTAATGDGSFARARQVSKGSSLAELVVTVPVSAEARLNIEAPFQLLDDRGASIRTGIPSVPVKMNDQTEIQMNVFVK
jgi:hypothetical protein